MASTTLANILLNRGDLGKRGRCWKDSMRCRMWVTALGAIACRERRLDDARQHLEAVVAAQPSAVMARLYLARTLDLLGDAAGAREHLEAARAAAPPLEEPRIVSRPIGCAGRGERAFEQGAVETALARLVAALASGPGRSADA